ncbi:MAG: HD domain-containing protein [Leptolyngbyaceae cyanobacterium]
MKLAAIDIGTNSIHMIIVDVISQRNFEVIEREKAMVKLGAGVFATKRISDRAFKLGLKTIRRYIQLAEQLGVDEIITAATSAIREAKNGEAFINAVVRQTGLSPRIISGNEEARLILLAVRNSIANEEDTALVLDIGGGSTETVVGNRHRVLFTRSLQLGVLRLLDMFEDSGPVGDEGRSVLESHIQYIAQKTLKQAKAIGFDRVIGTSGTIRTLGEAAHIKAEGDSFQSVNAEVVQLKHIKELAEDLLEMQIVDRAQMDGVGDKRADAIHLGGVLLVKLLEMVKVQEITLCDASLREGMVLDYLERHSQEVEALPSHKNLRYRQAAQLVQKYQSDWHQNHHIASLALQLFEQTKDLHRYGESAQDVLEFAALLHDIGQYISFRKHHKNSRFIIRRSNPRGFTDEEILLIRHLVRYHRKAMPTKKHKKFRRLSKSHRRLIKVLSGILRIAVSLDKTKNQRVAAVNCCISDESIKIEVLGENTLELEIWAAQRERHVLAAALDCTIDIYGKRHPLKIETAS